jgi:hypothetical protein
MPASTSRPAVNTHRHCTSSWAIDDLDLISEIEANHMAPTKRKKVIIQEIIAKYGLSKHLAIRVA